VFHAMKADLTIKPEGVCCDICNVFALPIPGTVWNKLKALQNKAFVNFVENCHQNGSGHQTQN
jgi:hypothetical protein